MPAFGIRLFTIALPAGSVALKRSAGPADSANPFDKANPFAAGAGSAAEQPTARVSNEVLVGEWNDRSASATQRAESLLRVMSSGEKFQLIHGTCQSCPYVGEIPGIPRLGIPPMNLHDGPQGIRNEPGARSTSTSWPGAMALTSTWDPDALHEWGVAMGAEFHDKGANVQLGPGFNIARVPLNGRNFEYMTGEDPYLGYKLAGPVVRGIQSQKIIACAKHYVMNSQENHRFDGNEALDERTLHEVYYPPFEAAIDAGIGSVMCSYNAVNGNFACENNGTLNTDLRDRMGFKGFVMSDWGGTRSNSLAKGLDMEMPEHNFLNEHSVESGQATQEQVDTAVRRILWAMFETGVMDEAPQTWSPIHFAKNVSTPEHIELSRKLGAIGTVLLKNDGAILPLPQNKKLALIGFADYNSWNLAYGHGSGEVVPSYFVPPTHGIAEQAGAGASIRFENGNNFTAAMEAAAEADYAVVFVGASASEGGDRQSLSLNGGCRINTFGRWIMCDGPDDYQNELVRAIAKAQKNTVVVLSVPGAVVLPWMGEVPAALTNFMPGQEVGHAIADVLFGKVNPSARLPITMPNRDNELEFKNYQYPGVPLPQGGYHFFYEEKLLVGYRFYDNKSISFSTGFPFGHGLSYTTFEYSDIDVQSRSVSFNVKNVGSIEGAEVAQLYLDWPAEAGEPRQLKGFKKTRVLTPGQTERVTLELSPRDTSIWDETVHGWKLISGDFVFNVGASSRDFRLSAKANL